MKEVSLLLNQNSSYKTPCLFTAESSDCIKDRFGQTNCGTGPTVDKPYIKKPTMDKSSTDKPCDVDKLNINVIRQVLAVTLTQLL